MADIVIRDKNYSGVERIEVPKQGSGNAEFYDTENATAVNSDILATKTAFGTNGSITGTMPNNGAISGAIVSKDDEITIPAGYTSGGTVAIASNKKAEIVSQNIKSGAEILGVLGSDKVLDTTNGTAVANDLLSGKVAYSNGSEIVGAMVNNGTVGGTISAKDGSVVIPAGYTSGGTVSLAAAEALKLQSTNIRKNVTILGVTGDSNVVDTSNGTATAADVVFGKVAYSKGQYITGTYAPGAGNEYELITGSWLTYTGQYVNAEADILRWGLAYDASLPAVTNIAAYAMCYDRSCGDLYMQNLDSISEYAFFNNVNLEKLDAGKLTLIESAAFRNATNFATLIIRNTNSVATLSATSAFTGTKIAGGTGYVYVPDALVDNYKSATNWSTYANQIKGLSELP